MVEDLRPRAEGLLSGETARPGPLPPCGRRAGSEGFSPPRDPPADESAVTLTGIVKRFGDFTAVRQTSLEIAEGSFVTLLGPSGCGKTTTCA